jgi:hypothetical protein
MANRTWIGGGNNKADNPKLWDPAGVPQSGDNMWMYQGTMNISGDDFSSDALALLGRDTVNISHGSTVVATVSPGPATINIQGDNNLSFQVGNPGNPFGSSTVGTVNLAASSHWVGSFNVVADSPNVASLVVNTGSKSTFIDNSLSFVQGGGAHAIVNAEISGTTIVRVIDGGVLEVGGSVGTGQTVLLTGPSVLQVDHPKQFEGFGYLVGGKISLMGLVDADSYSFQNEMLSIFSGKSVIDTLRLRDATPNGFVVEQKSGSVNIVSFDPTNPEIGLPIHV